MLICHFPVGGSNTERLLNMVKIDVCVRHYLGGVSTVFQKIQDVILKNVITLCNLLSASHNSVQSLS
uniref:Uncharacterized protein n=1 Tax=Paramormyrops kingsleyae TaxID=1676925 RepID=A0A3B3RR81_9TELE